MEPCGKIPAPEEAKRLLVEAEVLNPGPWAQHARVTAAAASALAAHLPEMDVDTAAVLGLLHDIGRRAGVSGMRHVIDGYDYLLALGYPGAARICLTHSFPLQDVRAFLGKWDVTPSQLEFIQAYIAAAVYTPYDRLIQLCDALSLAEGTCLIEKRIVDVALRYGVNEFSVAKWKAILGIQADFEHVLGCSIYTLLPGVVETTFGAGLLGIAAASPK